MKQRNGSVNHVLRAYSSVGMQCRELPDTRWNPRHAASVFVFGNALWALAGNNWQKTSGRLSA